jgi:hypothetical protein
MALRSRFAGYGGTPIDLFDYSFFRKIRVGNINCACLLRKRHQT